MLSDKLQKALNDQIVAEIYSSYLYLSMAAYLESINLPGFSSWMKVQAQEELTHAMKIFQYVNDKGGKVVLGPIDGPPTEWDSQAAVAEAVCEHEAKVTGLINNLLDIAIQEHDHSTNIFLQWFVTEQVEEEASADELLNKVKLVGDNPQGLYILDKELSARTFVMPVKQGGE